MIHSIQQSLQNLSSFAKGGQTYRQNKYEVKDCQDDSIGEDSSTAVGVYHCEEQRQLHVTPKQNLYYQQQKHQKLDFFQSAKINALSYPQDTTNKKYQHEASLRNAHSHQPRTQNVSSVDVRRIHAGMVSGVKGDEQIKEKERDLSNKNTEIKKMPTILIICQFQSVFYTAPTIILIKLPIRFLLFIIILIVLIRVGWYIAIVIHSLQLDLVYTMLRLFYRHSITYLSPPIFSHRISRQQFVDIIIYHYFLKINLFPAEWTLSSNLQAFEALFAYSMVHRANNNRLFFISIIIAIADIASADFFLEFLSQTTPFLHPQS